jgi:hypothetical protein
MWLTLGAACLQHAHSPSRRSRFTGQSGSWQSYGLSDDGCHDRYGKQNRTYRDFAELHRIWLLFSAPKAASCCVARAHSSSKRRVFCVCFHHPVVTPKNLLSGPEGPEPALGSLGARCSSVFREIHCHIDAAPASAAEMPPDGSRRAR